MWGRLLRLGMSVGATLLIGIILLQLGPLTETSMFPAVSHARVISATASADGQSTQLQVEFTRQRECQYLGLGWYQRTSDGAAVRLHVQLGQPAGVSSPGRLPTFLVSVSVPVPLAQLHATTYAEVFHHCHPLWLTTSEFYP